MRKLTNWLNAAGKGVIPVMDLGLGLPLQNSSGGNFDNFIHKKFCDKVPYFIILTINILMRL